MTRVLRSTMGLCLLCSAARAEEAPAPPADADVIQLGEIVVTPARSPRRLAETADAVSVVLAGEARARNARDLAGVLEGAPGVEVTRYGGPGTAAAITMRGATGRRVLVMQDGRPLNDAAFGGFDASASPSLTAERVEVLRGPSGLLYGANALGGVVNVLTPAAPSSLSAGLDAQAGEAGTTTERVRLGGPLGPARGLLEFSRLDSAGFRPHSAAAGQGWLVKGEVPGEIKATLTAGGWDGRTDNPGVVPAADPAMRSASELAFGDDEVASRVDRQSDVRRYGDGKVEAAAGAHRLSLRAYGENNRTVARYGSWMGLNEVTVDATRRLVAGAEAQDTLATGWPGAVEVTAGGGWRQEHVVADQTTEDLVGTALAALPRAHVWLTTWSGFVESAARPWAPLTAAVGGRLDRHSYFGTVANPHAGLALAAGPAVFRVSAGTTFGAPTAGDLSPRYGGNPALKPERGKTLEGGVEAKAGPLTARLGGYGRAVTDQIEWAPDATGSWSPQNVTEVTTRGIEGGLAARRGGLRAEASVTTIASFERVPDGLGGLLPARRAAHVPTWTGGALVGAEFPTGTGASLALRAGGTRRMYTTDVAFLPATKKLAPYGVLTLRVSQKLFGHAEAYAGVENLADAKFATHFGNTLFDGDYPAPGRSFFGGASVRW